MMAVAFATGRGAVRETRKRPATKAAEAPKPAQAVGAKLAGRPTTFPKGRRDVAGELRVVRKDLKRLLASAQRLLVRLR